MFKGERLGHCCQSSTNYAVSHFSSLKSAHSTTMISRLFSLLTLFCAGSPAHPTQQLIFSSAKANNNSIKGDSHSKCKHNIHVGPYAAAPRAIYRFESKKLTANVNKKISFLWTILASTKRQPIKSQTRRPAQIFRE